MAIRNKFRPFGKFYGHLIINIGKFGRFFPVLVFYQEISGNPGSEAILIGSVLCDSSVYPERRSIASQFPFQVNS
jgi:hypothetical protein